MSGRSIKFVATGAFLVWFGWALLPVFAGWASIEYKVEQLGSWGDAFGALNAMFSALAFVAVLYTINQQQKQIDDTTNDQHLQRFERTFYELIRLLREARDAVEFRYSEYYEPGANNPDKDYVGLVKGTEAFKRAQFEMTYWVDAVKASNRKIETSELANIYRQRIHARYESTFSPYYRLLYALLLRIKTDKKISANEKVMYGNLLRSQLTSHEVAMCAYNGLAATSGSFSDLLVDFRLLKYLPKEFGGEILRGHYPEMAFVGRDVHLADSSA